MGEDTLGMFMDLSRAFDSISHEKLYRKLYHIGIRGFMDLSRAFDSISHEKLYPKNLYLGLFGGQQFAPVLAKEFVISSEKSISGLVWWAAICSSSKISRLAVDIFNLPSSTAATERTFSTYRFIHRQRRNRLTVESAGKVNYIAYNCNLLNEEDHSRIVEATDEEIEKEDIGFEVIDLTQLTKEKEELDDEVGDDDEHDLPLLTLLLSPF
ncbi:hAT family C-terminal dimerization region [Popillia japonica]|uniref:HAT family C-terminal dimerization region n=1 Tax=Popillia japonica TaxID=7064 RepID=A0AAW1IZ78_POPJA